MRVSYHCVLIQMIKSTWERELGMLLEDEVMDHAVDNIRSTTSSASLGLIQFKVLHRVHFSRSKLSIIYPYLKDECDRCHGSSCNLINIFFLLNLAGFLVWFL